MSDPKSFITRWSRRKRAAGQLQVSNSREATAVIPRRSKSDLSDFDHDRSDELGQARVRPGEVGEQCEPGGGRGLRTSPPADGARGPASEPFDVTSLPPIESITAETDVRGFLAPGVPPELTRAALRRAWAADPKIREFIGLSENSWDFNAPDSMAGFGPLEMTDELRRQIMAMVGRNLAGEAPGKDVPASMEALGTQAKPTTADQSLEHNSGTAQAAIGSNIPERADPIPQRNVDDRTRQHDAGEPDCSQSAAKRRHGRALPE
jgi:hypothetical protein